MNVTLTEEVYAECLDCHHTWRIESYGGTVELPQCPCGSFNVKTYDINDNPFSERGEVGE